MTYIIGGNTQKAWETVKADEWITGKIVSIKHRLNENKVKTDAKTGEKKIVPTQELRFELELDGYKELKSSTYMTESMSENAKLYKVWVSQLIVGIPEYTKIDVDKLIGTEVKVMYTDVIKKDGTTGQYIEKVKPLKPIKLEDVVVGDTEEDVSIPF